MKKYIVWIILAGSFLLVGCSKTPGSEVNNPETATTEDQDVFKWTAKDLLEKGDNVVCSFTFEDETSKEEGTIYVLDGNIKSTTKVLLKKENMNMEAYMVTKDDYTYTRSNIQKSQGAKFKNIKADEESSYEKDPLNEKEVNFVCKETTIDPNMFTVPNDISFMDITDYLKDK